MAKPHWKAGEDSMLAAKRNVDDSVHQGMHCQRARSMEGWSLAAWIQAVVMLLTRHHATVSCFRTLQPKSSTHSNFRVALGHRPRTLFNLLGAKLLMHQCLIASEDIIFHAWSCAASASGGGFFVGMRIWREATYMPSCMTILGPRGSN